MYGFLEVITLMLALGGFGVDANPKAPSADSALEYAVDDADLVVHLDVAAVAPRNYGVLLGLPDDAAVKANPELLKMAKLVKANVEGVQTMSKTVVGLDLVNDLESITVFVTVVPNGDPQPMAVVRGTIPKDFVKKLASASGGGAGTIDGRATLEVDAETFLGTSKNGALIVGPRALVEPRIDDDWTAPTRKKGSAWTTIASMIDDKPFLLAAAMIDEKSAAALGKESGDNFLSDLVTGHELAVLALHSDGFAFHWKDRTKAGLERVALAADGTIEILRAAHIAPRGFAKLAVAALESYAGQAKEVDALIAHKDQLLKVVEEYTGKGDFKVAVDKKPKARTLTVRATGSKLSDVIPGVVLVPIAAGVLMMSGESSSSLKSHSAGTSVKRAGGGMKKPATKKPAKKPATKKKP